MREHWFISKRLRFRNRVVMASVAVSYLVMIVAVAVSSGFRQEIRGGLSAMFGDIQITPPNQSVLDASRPIEKSPSYLKEVEALGPVNEVVPVIYKSGIIKVHDNIHGVLLKGLPEGYARVSPGADADSVALAVSIPKRLSEITGLVPGDKMLTYFIGEKTKVRQFNVVAVYDAMLQTDDRLVVYSNLADLQRVDGWDENQVSALEVHLSRDARDAETISDMTSRVSEIVYEYSYDSESPVIASSTMESYPQLFNWLDLIDFNVLFVIILMTLVAGFNMISGLLIMLFENISTIGVFKALGMRNRSVSWIFILRSSGFLFKSMLIGNILAVALCLIQDYTHVLTLNPDNYFVSFVPVSLDFGAILIADAVSFAAIMLILLLSSLFISRVDPADTVRMK